ncbi:sigma-70 family RNA polymerase sigma factor [Helcococcus ovis]|uniref:Sigma-70 family RNA polymerase sigma factor n=1 Tax=Helcococcus ovis TaxID=72026 RepID=A0A4R9C109_9FIRM|nr:sigma-70 family RNA polymerase sigma factor [Helcococcus ovis]TFF65472.1 sigma-70 family RNA polymerase sigma factor [Helcococcus ovis]TFF65710.1 sigma-70 family RNA polymerase sigma factor [Helcococcus ovis]TFF68476.1 sigma-70 family RNA polymerase sigma factor [Helcococcus ovis]WNZ01465.1 sigma-70 family RNA polymerase sigma factor [Helcococcus ovis]
MKYVDKLIIEEIFEDFYKYNKEYKNIIKEEQYKYFINKRRVKKSKKKFNIKNTEQLMFLLFSMLDKKEKDLIEMKFKYRMSITDICTILYISESTYHRRMRKIYSKMSKYIKEFEGLFNIK